MIFRIFNQILGINLGHRFARRPKQACCFIAKIEHKTFKDLAKNKQRTNAINEHHH